VNSDGPNCVFTHDCRERIRSDIIISIDVTVPWSVCLFVFLSRSSIVLKRQKISTRFILHVTAPCLSQIALKFGLHLSIPSSPDVAPN